MLCQPFSSSAFFLQGQMDIHPKSLWHNPAFVEATGGFFPDKQKRAIKDLEPWDNTRRDMIILLLRTMIEHQTPGDFAEVGVYKGSTARLIHHYAPERCLHLFDTFEGFGPTLVMAEKTRTGHIVAPSHFGDTNVEAVRRYIAPLNANVYLYKGLFPGSVPPALDSRRYSFVHLDVDLYESTLAGLQFFYPRMSPGGMILVHDYNAWPGARKAVDEFMRGRFPVPIPMPDKSGSALILC
jgi:O-methyltransferase